MAAAVLAGGDGVLGRAARVSTQEKPTGVLCFAARAALPPAALPPAPLSYAAATSLSRILSSTLVLSFDSRQNPCMLLLSVADGLKRPQDDAKRCCCLPAARRSLLSPARLLQYR